MKPLLLVLLLALPANAQSIYPNAAGARYCQLRADGVTEREATKIAVAENYSADRVPVPVTVNGQATTTDILDFVRWVMRCK